MTMPAPGWPKQAGFSSPKPQATQRGMRKISPDHLQLFRQFFRFGVVGLLGVGVNAGVVYATRGLLGLYGAGAVAYPVAATFNWLINRIWTFRDSQTAHGIGMQWVRFLIVNLVGFALNYGSYSLLIYASELCREMPILAVAAGAIVGMFANFGLSRRLVFT